jgi:hypothetical protein
MRELRQVRSAAGMGPATEGGRAPATGWQQAAGQRLAAGRRGGWRMRSWVRALVCYFVMSTYYVAQQHGFSQDLMAPGPYLQP